MELSQSRTGKEKQRCVLRLKLTSLLMNTPEKVGGTDNKCKATPQFHFNSQARSSERERLENTNSPFSALQNACSDSITHLFPFSSSAHWHIPTTLFDNQANT
ncbi:unnamed protein product [Sphenostylis stenocarpa]|uniref:Uncharacterized protein n=1 Tax=Sphenostylis stenocarpa TaxID=92480 RepID=A0AA86SLN0_9FABA|nr:unnamed protein product [Sphenostylis stenocarpa]